MPRQLHQAPNNRLAWLKPVRAITHSTGRWVLCESDFRQGERSGTPCAGMTVNGLLRLMVVAFEQQARQARETDAQECLIRSECGRYHARLIRDEKDTTRLFVQQRTDFFARMELYVDDQIVAAYQEPVWPHLQKPHPASQERPRIPLACIRMLETCGQASFTAQEAANAADTLYHSLTDNSAAA